ncbi:hypothetical protein [Leisingera thetidis]|uniref:hypothetical protein n=1 Tax=Leisingera thetidis TaxID=2930199 RepID=UPI0021F6A510|nr:hypothetical protein [Leisingera thetidis]
MRRTGLMAAGPGGWAGGEDSEIVDLGGRMVLPGVQDIHRRADLVVLSGNVLDTPLEDIGSVAIEAALLQGEAVLDDAGLFAE